jgi:hypothetical protein
MFLSKKLLLFTFGRVYVSNKEFEPSAEEEGDADAEPEEAEKGDEEEKEEETGDGEEKAEGTRVLIMRGTQT